MVIVLFKCPKCHIDIISPIQAIDETYAFANYLPVLMHCAACETPSLLVRCPNSCGIPPEWRCGKFLDMCLRVATVCRRRASETRNWDLQDFFLRMERTWLARARVYDLSQETALVAARNMRLRNTSEPRQIA